MKTRHHFTLGDIGDTTHDRRNELAELEEIERAIARRKGEIVKADEISKKTGPRYDIACKLHSTLCRSNHDDSCGWYYELPNGKHDWNGHTHKRYLDQADKLIGIAKLRNVDPEVMLDFVETMKAF